MYKNGYIWNHATCSSGNGRYAKIIIDDSVVIGNEIVKETKTVPTKAVLSKCTSTKVVLIKYTSTNFYILMAFSLITIALLIAVSI